MGLVSDLPKGRRQQIRIRELLAVSGLVGDGFDHAARQPQIVEIACRKAFQLGHGCAEYFTLGRFVGELRTER